MDFEEATEEAQPQPGESLTESCDVSSPNPGAAVMELEAKIKALDALLDKFVALAQRRGQVQRSEGWYRLMSSTIGGSEISAIMRDDASEKKFHNPYMSFEDVVASKAGAKKWRGGGPACWWGSMFEDVVARVVELDLGTRVVGDEICVEAIPGHRNSPDGFCVVRFYFDHDDNIRIWTTNSPQKPTHALIVLLEIKSPYNRLPNGKVVQYYRPQIWSGLAVSPVASLGLFVDAAFRKCAIDDLELSMDYDTAYHRQKPGWPHKYPFAWGLIAVYAPRLDAPHELRMFDSEESLGKDAAQEAWAIHSRYFGMAKAPDCIDVVDFGDCNPRLFDKALELIDKKKFKTVHPDPCFFDGPSRPSGLRGEDLAVGAAIDQMRGAAPEHYYLLGVIPWKLFEINYVPQERRPGFREELEKMATKVHTVVGEAQKSGDAAAYVADWIKSRRPAPHKASHVEETRIFDELYAE